MTGCWEPLQQASSGCLPWEAAGCCLLLLECRMKLLHRKLKFEVASLSWERCGALRVSRCPPPRPSQRISSLNPPEQKSPSDILGDKPSCLLFWGMETRRKKKISLSTSASSSAADQRLSWDRVEQLCKPEHPCSRMSAPRLPPVQVLLLADGPAEPSRP